MIKKTETQPNPDKNELAQEAFDDLLFLAKQHTNNVDDLMQKFNSTQEINMKQKMPTPTKINPIYEQSPTEIIKPTNINDISSILFAAKNNISVIKHETSKVLKISDQQETKVENVEEKGAYDTDVLRARILRKQAEKRSRLIPDWDSIITKTTILDGSKENNKK